ncbi:hypothetical protein Tco_0435824 [Tanacetum coccineum]
MSASSSQEEIPPPPPPPPSSQTPTQQTPHTSDIKGSTASSSSSPQNVAFVSENTNNTNEVSTAYCVPNLSGQNTKYEQTSSYSLHALNQLPSTGSWDISEQIE